MDLQLKGKTAIVTGASRGIGRGIARVLAGEGCHLHLAARSEPDLTALRTEILSTHDVEVTCHALDLSKPEAVLELARRCGAVDILVNNAGDIPFGRLLDIDGPAWRNAWNLKVFGTIDLTREVYAGMRKQRSGVIINIIGLAGERPRGEYIAGATGNAALMAFTKALGGESVEFGIRILGLNPGQIDTDRIRETLKNQAEKKLGDRSRWEELARSGPLGRIGRPEEIADVVAFLASERSSYMSGTIVTVDAGRSVRDNA